MSQNRPHYLLFSETKGDDDEVEGRGWRFILESTTERKRFEAADNEISCADRLELLAVVRGLESLDQPSRITLVTKSDYVSRGIRYGVTQWRQNDWRWESFGRMRPIRDQDLWRRLNHAMGFHQLDCVNWRFDGHETVSPSKRMRNLIKAKATASDTSPTTDKADSVSDEVAVQLISRRSPIQAFPNEREFLEEIGKRLQGSSVSNPPNGLVGNDFPKTWRTWIANLVVRSAVWFATRMGCPVAISF